METLTTNSNFVDGDARRRTDEILALVVVWCREAPERIGEVLLPDAEAEPAGGWLFGRGEPGPDHLPLVRQRCGHNLIAAPLELPRVSQEQLRIRSIDRETLELHMDNWGEPQDIEVPDPDQVMDMGELGTGSG